jgi:hypothetical protein
MDGDKVASIATAAGGTGLALNFYTIGVGLLAIAAIGGIGYATYRVGKAACKRISELHKNEVSEETPIQDGLE